MRWVILLLPGRWRLREVIWTYQAPTVSSLWSRCPVVCRRLTVNFVRNGWAAPCNTAAYPKTVEQKWTPEANPMCQMRVGECEGTGATLPWNTRDWWIQIRSSQSHWPNDRRVDRGPAHRSANPGSTIRQTTAAPSQCRPKQHKCNNWWPSWRAREDSKWILLGRIPHGQKGDAMLTLYRPGCNKAKRLIDRHGGKAWVYRDDSVAVRNAHLA